MTLRLAFFAVFAFFCGAIPMAYWVGKRFKNIDIREHGSGNVGSTNAFRVLGRGPGLFVFVFDFAKGYLPVFLFTGDLGADPSNAVGALLVGLAAMLGHIFSPFLGFKGGKGVATGAGVLAALYPLLFVLTMLVWLATFLFSRTVSISSLTALFSLVIFSFFLQPSRWVTLFLCFFFLLILWTHRSNLQRLFSGQEKSL